MITSFGDKKTKKVFNQEFSSELPEMIQKRALHRLMQIDNAENINDLRVPPGNHLEKLEGNLKNSYSIRINGQYRISFKVKNENEFISVKIEDYH